MLVDSLGMGKGTTEKKSESQAGIEPLTSVTLVGCPNAVHVQLLCCENLSVYSSGCFFYVVGFICHMA